MSCTGLSYSIFQVGYEKYQGEIHQDVFDFLDVDWQFNIVKISYKK